MTSGVAVGAGPHGPMALGGREATAPPGSFECAATGAAAR